LNRIMIRGVTAGLIGTVLMGAAAVVGPAIASGAESGVDWNRPLPATQQAAAMHWRLPAVGYLKHVHRPHKRAVSHATVRLALTGSPQTIAHAMLLRRGWA
jgi:hypothetical protein